MPILVNLLTNDYLYNLWNMCDLIYSALSVKLIIYPARPKL